MTETMDFSALAGLDADAIRCPYPTYAQFREGPPAVWVPQIEAWLVTGYAEICKVARQPKIFSSRMVLGPVTTRERAKGIRALAAEDPELGAKISKVLGYERVMILADPPNHLRQRRLVARAFTPARIKEAEPDIRRIIDLVADRLAEAGRVDFVNDYAVPVPMLVITELLGMPPEDLPEFKRWSDEVVKTIGSSMDDDQLRDSMLAQYEMFGYFANLVAKRRAHPGNDLISLVIATADEDEPLSDREVLNVLMQFLIAGNETTTKALSFGVRMLLEDPALAQRLRADRSLIPAFVEEALRLESPLQCLFRVATQDTDIGRVPIKAGDCVVLSWASGNRDDRQWPVPDEVNLEGASPKQLAFGMGEHQCIGAALARAEMRITFEVLFDRFDMHFPAGVSIDQLDYEPSYILRGMKELPVEFTARAT